MRDVFECRRFTRRGRSRRGGFSLVELLVVTVLVASSALIATPVFSAWHARDRIDAAARALLAGLTLARGEAIARGTRVVVCPTDAQAQCLPKGHRCAGGAHAWSCDWMVVVDPERAAQVLRVYRRPSGVSILAAAGAVEFTPPVGQVIGGFRKFEFAATGRTVVGQTGAWNRCIRIAAGGRVRLERGGCSGRARA
jgi:type IV fimbrial biogenesis protein FimT